MSRHTSFHVTCALQAELWNPRVLFLFGTYTIGKERLFLQVGGGGGGAGRGARGAAARPCLTAGRGA